MDTPNITYLAQVTATFPNDIDVFSSDPPDLTFTETPGDVILVNNESPDRRVRTPRSTSGLKCYDRLFKRAGIDKYADDCLPFVRDYVLDELREILPIAMLARDNRKARKIVLADIDFAMHVLNEK
jgi:hypothetical protein